MSSWLEKASSLIDTIEQGVNDQLKSAVGISGDADDDTLTTEDRIDEEDEVSDDDSDENEVEEEEADEEQEEAEDKSNTLDTIEVSTLTDDIEESKDDASKHDTNATIENAQIPPPDPSKTAVIDSPQCNGSSVPSPTTNESDPPLPSTNDSSEITANPQIKSTKPSQGVTNGDSTVISKVSTSSSSTTNAVTASIAVPSNPNVNVKNQESRTKSESVDTVSDALRSSHSIPSPPSSQLALSAVTNHSKPRKQSKTKSKKSKSKQNKSRDTVSSTNHSDYKQLKKQYEGMVKLWNEERANLKKAQHLLRSQKDKFKMEQNDINESHLAKMDKITAEYELQIALKNKSIQSLEAALLKVKEERNDKIEDKDRLNDVIGELKAEREEILREKALITKEKQEQIELIRREFEMERKGWEKERKILTKNFERESFLESENQEFTSALARTQSALQQKELEHSRIAGELRWIKQDKEEMAKTNAILKEENATLNGSVDELKEVIREKSQEIMQLKEEQSDALQLEQDRFNKLQIEHLRMKEENERSASNQVTAAQFRQSQRGDFEQRIQALTADLLEKQTELDRVMSQRNEYKIAMTKMEEAMNAQSSDVVVGMEAKGHVKDVELGVLTNRARRKEHPTGRLPRKNYTSWQTINEGIGIFDKIGLEFAHILRNKPWVRLLILFYVLILHLWCFLVLHFSLNFEQDDSH